MFILFGKCKGVKIATTLIFEAIDAGASFSYVSGMIDFAQQFGAITAEEAKSLYSHLAERDRQF